MVAIDKNLFTTVIAFVFGIWTLLKYRSFAKRSIEFWGLPDFLESRRKYYERFGELLYFVGGLIFLGFGIYQIYIFYIR